MTAACENLESLSSMSYDIAMSMVVMNMTLKNFDSVENFDIPAEALDAELIQ